MYFVKTPRIIRFLYKDYFWCINTNKKELFLTFDDGPTPKVTSFVLDTLKKYNAKATFFCIGKNIIKHPKLFQRIIDEGHLVANHTNNHLNGWKTKSDTYLTSVHKTQTIIESFNLKKTQKYFRPPYGKIKLKQAKQLITKGYKIIMWSVLSGDFDTSITKEKCLSNVLNNTRKGSIIVFHDSEKAFKKMKYTLPKTLEHFKDNFVFCEIH